ncbi:hypothetical protein ABT294_39625 [Nonomuraea sp. NPDC000554]|uniref:hypothetical protein n=1 Tax=Nonomuraea sp. NPDC000554 TaxID=3154259 RepID=UPI00332F7073
MTSWTALGKRHPGAVLEAAEQELSAGADVWSWWRRRGAGVTIAALAEPSRLLTLLERHDLRHRIVRLPAAVLGALFKADAARATAVLTRAFSRSWADPPKALISHLRSASDAEILAVASADAHRLGTILRSLPPGRRAAIFDAAAERRGGSTGLWAMPLLASLPAERAAIEARRMLGWHASVWHSARSRLDDPDIPLKLTSYLPYEEAAGPLREAAFGGDPRRRGLARTLLVRCTARAGDRTRLRALLAELARRTANEQDPLRCGLLTAMCGIAPSMLDDSHARTLDRIAADAVQAPDSSPATQDALRRLAGRVLRHHDPVTAPALTAWALRTYGELVARHGAGGLPAPQPAATRRRRRTLEAPAESHRLDRVLRRGQEHDLLAVLRPHLRAGRGRGDFTLAVALARALGQRAWVMNELQEDLRAAVRSAPVPIARQAAELWLQDTSEREDRVADLVRVDSSAVALPPVWRTIAGRRTDLLLPLLEGERQGRFADSPWVVRVSGGVAGRWTPDQRDRMRLLLAAVVDDGDLPVAVRVAAVQATGRICGGVERLATWSSREETVLAEAAVGALTSTDVPDRALPLLLAHARGRASRVAVAALARCCRAVAPSRLGHFLEQALTDPGGKVTLRKQAARQLERNRPPGAVDLLLRAWADPGLHRDVRVAVASALRRIPEDPRTLDALGAAADRYADEPVLRTLFQAGPLEYAPAARPGYADLVRRLLMAADDPGVRFRGSKAFAAWAGWYQGGFDQILTAVGDSRTADGETVMPVFLALLRTGTIRAQALDVLARLAAAVPADGQAVSPRPPVQARVASIAGQLAAMQLPEARPWQRGLARDAVNVLAAQPLLLSQAARLAVAVLPTPADGRTTGLGDALCALADLLRDRPILAAQTAGRMMSDRFGRYGAVSEVAPAALLPAARRLTDRGDLAAGLFALALARVAGERTDWADPWRELLRDLRDHPHLEVRQAAWDTSAD